MFDIGCDQQLNEIAVSDRGTLRGLTQFCGRLESDFGDAYQATLKHLAA